MRTAASHNARKTMPTAAGAAMRKAFSINCATALCRPRNSSETGIELNPIWRNILPKDYSPAMEPAYKLLNVVEFLDVCPNDQRHYQLIDGVIVAMAPPATRTR